MRYGPNRDAVYPNEAIKQVCFIKIRLPARISSLGNIPITMM